MKSFFACSAALAMGMVSSASFASPGIRTYKILDEATIGTDWQAPAAATVAHVIYLNNCKPNGCSMKAGQGENSTTNASTVPTQPSIVQPYTGSDTTWQQVVNCVKQTYADFDVQIVTDRPTSGSYHMAIVAGSPSNVQQKPDVMGVSPFSCGYINNATSYTFANVAPNDVNELCWTIAQETAHSWGLDHKYDNRDPMTYLSGGPATKRFQDEGGTCGEYSARGCKCSYAGTTQKMNSHAAILAVFGSSAPDVTAPTVTVTYPNEMDKVTPGFPVMATTIDDRFVEKVELRLDGMLVGMKAETTTFNMNTPSTLTQGKHKIEVTAYDHAGNKTASVVNVQYGTVCTRDSECDTAGSVCISGHCEAGPSVTGGLGTECTGNGGCSSGQCGMDADHGYCVATCEIGAANACPSDFSCVDTGNGGVCWPSSSGGCNASGSSNVWLMALGLVGLVMTRRRRR